MVTNSRENEFVHRLCPPSLLSGCIIMCIHARYSTHHVASQQAAIDPHELKTQIPEGARAKHQNHSSANKGGLAPRSTGASVVSRNSNVQHSTTEIIPHPYKGCVELQVRETVRDVQFLHNEQYFAVAQKKYVYIYDKRGLEVHCLKVLTTMIQKRYVRQHASTFHDSFIHPNSGAKIPVCA